MILVAALNVSSITTVWQSKQENNKKLMLSKGEEMGQFNLGSTVLLLFPETSEIQWFDTLKVGGNLRMGEIIARISNHQKQT